jgi:hypothetical protein
LPEVPSVDDRAAHVNGRATTDNRSRPEAGDRRPVVARHLAANGPAATRHNYETVDVDAGHLNDLTGFLRRLIIGGRQSNRQHVLAGLNVVHGQAAVGPGSGRVAGGKNRPTLRSHDLLRPRDSLIVNRYASGVEDGA